MTPALFIAQEILTSVENMSPVNIFSVKLCIASPSSAIRAPNFLDLVLDFFRVYSVLASTLKRVGRRRNKHLH